MKLTPEAAYFLIRDAGFTPDQAAMPLAVTDFESGFDPFEIGLNKGSNPSVDRGIVQWNGLYHPEVTNEMAFTPALAYREMRRVSGGNDFSQWSTNALAHQNLAKYQALIDNGGFEAAYQESQQPPQPLPRPSDAEVCEAACSLGHFTRNGFGLDALIPADKAVIKWAASQV